MRKFSRLLASGDKTVFYKDFVFKVYPEVYEPAEDTFFIADHMDVRSTDLVLDLGTGCGILAILAAKAGAKVVATDLNPAALECARVNALLNGLEDKIEFRLGDLFRPVAGERFDLIIFNPPYLPVERSEELGGPLDIAWEAGPDGRRILDKFLRELPGYLAPKGRAIFIQSSLSNISKTMEILKEKRFKVDVLKNKLWFEELYLVVCDSEVRREIG